MVQSWRVGGNRHPSRTTQPQIAFNRRYRRCEVRALRSPTTVVDVALSRAGGPGRNLKRGLICRTEGLVDLVEVVRGTALCDTSSVFDLERRSANYLISEYFGFKQS